MEEIKDVTIFFAAAPSVTTGYLARAVVNNVLKGGQLATKNIDDNQEEEDFCKIS